VNLHIACRLRKTSNDALDTLVKTGV